MAVNPVCFWSNWTHQRTPDQAQGSPANPVKNQPGENPNLRITPVIMGRGSALQIANRFEKVHFEPEFDQLEPNDQSELLNRKIPTEYYFDRSNSIISQNNSPDLDFNYSLNPYRGCSHGCSYCYARPTHEFLGFNAGMEFESKIVIKPDAPSLFRNWLMRPAWQVEPIMLSGVTDCYQNCERKFQLTRQCIETALELRQPLRLITKNGMIRRDIELLSQMANLGLIEVSISLTTLDQSLVRIMEPRTSSPQARLDTIKELSDAGIPVRTSLAPIIPGINEQEIPELLKAAKLAGAISAHYIMLRLPLSVEPVFLDWVEHYFPDRKDKIIGRLQSVRNGKLSSSDFKTRMIGTGVLAQQVAQLFTTFATKYGLKKEKVRLRTDLFRPVNTNGQYQQRLF